MAKTYRPMNHLSPSKIRAHEKRCVKQRKIKPKGLGKELMSIRGRFLRNTLGNSFINEPTTSACKNNIKIGPGKTELTGFSPKLYL